MVESHRIYDEAREDGKGGHSCPRAPSPSSHSGTLYEGCCRRLQDTPCTRNSDRHKDSCSQKTTRKIIRYLGDLFGSPNLIYFAPYAEVLYLVSALSLNYRDIQEVKEVIGALF